MPRHSICDAYEWINEIPSVPIYHSANLQPRERSWLNIAGKEDPVEFDSSLILRSSTAGVEQVVGATRKWNTTTANVTSLNKFDYTNFQLDSKAYPIILGNILMTQLDREFGWGGTHVKT